MSWDHDGPFDEGFDWASDGAGSLLVRAATLYRRLEGAQFRARGFTSAQLELLWALEHAVPGREPRQRDLVHVLHQHAVVVNRNVARLERLGLLARLPDPTDKRSQRLQLTEKGREAVNPPAQKPYVPPHDFFAAIGKERKGLERLLRTLLRANDPAHEGAPSLLKRRAESHRR